MLLKTKQNSIALGLPIVDVLEAKFSSGVDFTKWFKTWHKFSTEIRFMLIPIIVLFIAHEFTTGNF